MLYKHKKIILLIICSRLNIDSNPSCSKHYHTGNFRAWHHFWQPLQILLSLFRYRFYSFILQKAIIGSFNTYVSPVLKHRPGNNSFTYNDDFGDIHWTPRHNQYYLEASFELLDAPGEWFYNVETKVLYFIPPSGDCPDRSSTSLRG